MTDSPKDTLNRKDSLDIEIDLDELENPQDESEIKKLKAEKFLGKCLRNSRNRRGMTQKELASVVGISQSAYASYENGMRRCPGTVLIKISKALKMPIELILEQTRDYKQSQSYKDLESVIYNMPIDDLEAFAQAFEIEIAQSQSWLENERDTPAIKWAGKGIDIAQKVNKRGQDMIEQFINSVMANPAMLKQKAPDS